MPLDSPAIADPATETAAALSGSLAVSACAAMAIGYVAILYAPTLVLRLPPPPSFDSFLIRRFACAAISSATSVLASAALLGVRFTDFASILGVFGLRKDHAWQAAVFPLFLTSLLYFGSLASRLLVMIAKCREGRSNSRYGVRNTAGGFVDWACGYARNVMVWRNYVVAPLTEELVFRACMIPLLLCGRFKVYNIIFFSPVFFSLAHLNHFLELYYQQKYSFMKAFLIVGLQLGYTVIFGWYACFLFIRTGNLIAPIVAHIFCNMMGLPVLSSSYTKGIATLAFLAGLTCFCWLLFPASSPDLYNDRIDNCSCWHGYCSWH